jgi:UDP-N-acetylglucosamine 1-carboxyvinyltransferase
MDMYQIEGARSLRGDVTISGSKNACLPLLMAAVLSDEPTTIDNVPDLRDIREMRRLVEHIGATVTFANGRMVIDPSTARRDSVPYDLMNKMRASFYAMGPLLARFGRAKVSIPGGCAIGDRPVDLHLRGFEALGAQLSTNAGYIIARATPGTFRGARMSLMGPCGTSVGATCNVMMAATLARGTTIIDDAAREPEVVELARFLRSMGADISGEGTNRIQINGVEKLHGTTWTACFDRIEAATFAVAALITHGDVTMHGVGEEALGSTLQALSAWGASLEWTGPSSLRVRRDKGPKRALALVTEPWPGLATDVQAQLAALLALTPGTSSIRDTIYPERFKYVPEFKRLGARVGSPEAGRVTIEGVPALAGAAVMASDLRAGAALVLAALAAHGTSQVRRIYHIERGYERFEEKLRALGAVIERRREEEFPAPEDEETISTVSPLNTLTPLRAEA